MASDSTSASTLLSSETSLPKGLSAEDSQSLPHAVECISDDTLRETAFKVYLKRVALLLTSGGEVSTEAAEQHIEYAVQVLWELHMRSGHSLNRKFANYVASESQLVSSILKVMCTCLETYATSKCGSRLVSMYTRLLHLVCNSVLFKPESVTHVQDSEDLIKRLVQVVSNAAFVEILDDVVYGRSISAILVMLYVSAINPSICQLLKQGLCVKNVQTLIKFPFTELRLISKALIARLIPVDATSDDMAPLILVKDDDVNLLISASTSHPARRTIIPLVPVLMDLSRSPCNVSAFASRDVASVLSSIMDSVSKVDQDRVAHLIWMMMESNHKGSEDSQSAVINNGTIQDLSCLKQDNYYEEIGHGQKVYSDFLSYIVRFMKTYDIKSTTTIITVIKNLTAAIMLQHNILQKYDERLIEDCVSDIESSPEIYPAIQKLTSLVCNGHFGGATKEVAHYLYDVVLECLLWWTCYSERASTGLSRTGIVTNLINNLVRICIQLKIQDIYKVHLCLKVLINLASTPTNWPAFNSSLSQSDIIVSVLPLTHGQDSNLALCCKFLLALLSPLLDCEQLNALKLTRDEAKMCMSLLNEATVDPRHVSQDCSLLTLLRAMIWFVHEYSRKSKALDVKNCSEYEKKMGAVSHELESNTHLLVEEGFLSLLKSVLKLRNEEELQATAARLAWCLAHNMSIRTKMLDDAELIQILKDAQNDESPQLSMASFCVLWLLGVQANDDSMTLLQYANGCLQFENYYECIEICDVVITATNSDTKSNLMSIEAKMTKGKASFYVYKRKFQHIVVLNDNLRATPEGRNILYNECFNHMKEAISLLGHVLDENMLDKEGSKLLDWAMIDCLSTTNQLNKCNRCLLCRQKRSLSRSHVWPKFITLSLQDDQSLDDERSIIFGLDKHQLKSAGACTYWMFCARCEEILSQNGESDFKSKFPSEGEIEYSPWLFSFCAGIIFRTLSATVKFPMHFNDDEIYKVLLLCRKHLLSLPVKGGDKIPSCLSNSELKQLKELTQHLKEHLDIYLFISPLTAHQRYHTFQDPYPFGAFAISRNKQLHDKQHFFNGHAHFFLLCCGPITLIVEFGQPFLDHSLTNRGFHITDNADNSDQKYIIPSEEDCVKLLPVGVWEILEQLTEGSLQDFNQVLRFTSSKAKKLTIKSCIAPSPVVIPIETSSNVMLPVSFLPKGYEIIKPHSTLPCNQCVVLPKGHHVLIHGSRTVSMKNAVITFLLCINDRPMSTSCLESLYMIFLMQDNNSHYLYLDSTAVEAKNGELVLTTFLLQNNIASEMRLSISQLQTFLNIVLPNKHFDNIDLLIYLAKCHRCFKNTPSLTLPSLDRRCGPKGCWYCRDLCQHCMQPSSTLYSGVYGEDTIKFCSKECKQFWTSPESSDQECIRVECLFDEACQPQKENLPLITTIIKRESGLEQIFLSSCKVSTGSEERYIPFIVWHIREVERQRFAHFYISKDCLPCESVWRKLYCTSDTESISNIITSTKEDLQSHFQLHCNRAVKACGFDNVEDFLMRLKNSKQASLQTDVVPSEMDEVATRSNLPQGFIFCNPDIGFAHRSIKNPDDITDLLHYTEVDKSLQTMYLLAVTNLFESGLPQQLYFIMVKHHIVHKWYFIDGVVLSDDGRHATRYLLEEPFHSRESKTMEEVNAVVAKIIPLMLKKSGVSSILLLLQLTKYTLIDAIAIKSDLRCSACTNCWYCKKYCFCCSKFFYEDGSLLYCNENCRAMAQLDPSATPPVLLDQSELSSLLNPKNTSLIGFMKKVISTHLDKNTILKIYLGKADYSFDIIPQGTLYVFCQIKTSTTQIVIDALLSEDYVPLEPIWYSDYCQHMIDEHRMLLHDEIQNLVSHCM